MTGGSSTLQGLIPLETAGEGRAGTERHMAPQRRSSDTTLPPDAVAPTAAPALHPHPAAGFHIVARDAFRDKAEREARKRAEQAARRKGVRAATPSTDPPVEAEPSPALSPAEVEPPMPTRLVGAEGPRPPVVASRPTAAIIPWPRRTPVIASTDAPSVERPPEVEVPKTDAPKVDPKPASPAGPKPAPFNAAEFWGGKKKATGGGGGNNGGGGNGGGSGGVRKDGPFNQDDVAGAVIVLLVLLLIGWMLLNPGDKPARDDRMLQTQAALNAPVPAPPTVRPDPFPAGPIDLKPKSPIPEPAPEPAKAAPPITSQPVVTAQAAPSPPTPAVQPAGASCAPGRLIHAYFCTSRSDLTPAARTALDAAVAGWRSCAAGQELVVKGYADTRGAAEINAALGANRARTLADILRAQGLRVSEVDGVGELQGLEDGQNCANQRRVDVGLKSEIEAATPSRACRPPKEVAPIDCGPTAPKPVAETPTPAR
jgi:outer membrane protein OmpA-like peptidoglycan-associated protein